MSSLMTSWMYAYAYMSHPLPQPLWMFILAAVCYSFLFPLFTSNDSDTKWVDLATAVIPITRASFSTYKSSLGRLCFLGKHGSVSGPVVVSNWSFSSVSSHLNKQRSTHWALSFHDQTLGHAWYLPTCSGSGNVVASLSLKFSVAWSPSGWAVQSGRGGVKAICLMITSWASQMRHPSLCATCHEHLLLWLSVVPQGSNLCLSCSRVFVWKKYIYSRKGSKVSLLGEVNTRIEYNGNQDC